MTPPDIRPDAPARIVGGRYRLTRSIGSGGMGTVWEGTDELLGRAVAVKEVRFPPEVGDKELAELKERTMREARATARLSHPNVITTYDVVEDDDRPFIVMELLPTRSLSTVLREDGPLPPDRVAEIGLDLLSALESSHAQGVLHRDVKPGNVLLTSEGRAVLTDFGIASMAGDPALTSTGVVLGSPAYMAPERARGGKPGTASDLWSLGATLYSAVEGRPPYDADNALGTLTAVISDPVSPPTVEGPLREVILGLLAKDSAERLAVEEARELLRRAAADHSAGASSAGAATTVALERGGRTEALPLDRPVTPRPSAAPPPPPRETYDRPTERRNGALIAGLVVAILLIGGLVALALMDDDPQTPTAGDKSRDQTTSAPPTTSSQPEETQSSPPAEENNSGVPAGYRLHEDETGFAVAVPEDWQAEQSSATAVDISEPGGSRFLRIDQTDQPKKDPVKDWERQAKTFEAEQSNYQEIRIEEVDYRGWPAADWEFTFGENTHVLNRGFVTADDQAYALYMSSPDDQWSDSQQIFQVAADTFRPAGG